MKIDWKRKLTSRKLWVAIAGLATGIILVFKGDAATAETVGGVILQVASVVGYIIGEGLTDAAAISASTPEISEIDYGEEDDR